MTKLAYSVAETAEVLGVGENTVRREIAAGRLPHLYFRCRVLVPVEALREYLRSAA